MKSNNSHSEKTSGECCKDGLVLTVAVLISPQRLNARLVQYLRTEEVTTLWIEMTCTHENLQTFVLSFRPILDEKVFVLNTIWFCLEWVSLFTVLQLVLWKANDFTPHALLSRDIGFCQASFSPSSFIFFPVPYFSFPPVSSCHFLPFPHSSTSSSTIFHSSLPTPRNVFLFRGPYWQVSWFFYRVLELSLQSSSSERNNKTNLSWVKLIVQIDTC